MTTNEDVVLRLDAKLASIARTGRTAMLCFYVRGHDDDLALLNKIGKGDLILGVVVPAQGADDDSE